MKEFSDDKDYLYDNDSPEDLEMKVTYTYPQNPDYEIVSFLERVDFEEEKVKDLQRNKGFIIHAAKSTKKEVKNPQGIFSTKFGSKLGDDNPYQDRYSCDCGKLKGSMNRGLICPACESICKYIDDDFSIFGWIEIAKEYAVIHPTMYKQLDSFFGRSKYVKDKKSKHGSVLRNIIDFDPEIDRDGHIAGYKERKDEPFYGIGMIEFRNRFDEILEYYYNKNHKKTIYDDIIADKHLIFINSVPVFTTLLRPMDIVGDSMYYERTNELYTIMSKQAMYINRNKRSMDRNLTLKNQQLFRFQSKYMELYDEIVDILSGKKGELRTLVSGRFNFSSRDVIKQNPNLRMDQVELPYTELVITQEQRIINILHRTYNISYQEAYNQWFKAVGTVDPIIVSILNDMIKSSCGGEGLPVIINRNPTYRTPSYKISVSFH